MARFIALVIMVTPGIIGAFGIKLMRDALFYEVYPILLNAGFQFIVGLVLFIGGLAFIGGYLYYRDKKRHLLNNYKKNQTKE